MTTFLTSRRNFLRLILGAATALPFGLLGCSSTPNREGTPLGSWAEPIDAGVMAIHAALLHTGHVLLVGYHEGEDPLDSVRRRPSDSALIDPTASPENLVLRAYDAKNHRNIFCGHHAQLPDGRMLFAGGMYIRDTSIFDPVRQSWSPSPQPFGESPELPMHQIRWYPTCVTLPTGDILSIAGQRISVINDDEPTWEQNDLALNRDLEVFDHRNNTWGPLEALPQHVGPLEVREDIPRNRQPGLPGGNSYPFCHWLPTGKMFYHLGTHTWLYNRFGQNSPTWSARVLKNQYPHPRTYDRHGTSVLLPLNAEEDYQARVLILGGAGEVPNPNNLEALPKIPATNTAEILDLGTMSDPKPIEALEWRYTRRIENGTEVQSNMNYPRVTPDVVLLPDGNVFVVGGSASGIADYEIEPVLEPEIFNPISETWTKMAPMAIPRLYHSTALLLPDGRVMTGGRDGLYNICPYHALDHSCDEVDSSVVGHYFEHRLEFFSPPYLARHQRPILHGVPQAISYGETFDITFELLREISGEVSPFHSAVLIRPSAVTHSVNSEQRYVSLEIASDRAPAPLPITGVQASALIAPPTPNIAPPGYYMLFILSGETKEDLVPSVSRFVKLG